MKTFKKIDFWISFLLIAFFTITDCIRQDETFVISYFTVGAWHVISMIVHYKNDWFIKKGSVRYYYHWIVLWIFALAGLGCIISMILMFVLYFMIIAAPVMAVYYTVLCYDEVYVKMKARPLALLK